MSKPASHDFPLALGVLKEAIETGFLFRQTASTKLFWKGRSPPPSFPMAIFALRSLW